MIVWICYRGTLTKIMGQAKFVRFFSMFLASINSWIWAFASACKAWGIGKGRHFMGQLQVNLISGLTRSEWSKNFKEVEKAVKFFLSTIDNLSFSSEDKWLILKLFMLNSVCRCWRISLVGLVRFSDSTGIRLLLFTSEFSERG